MGTSHSRALEARRMPDGEGGTSTEIADETDETIQEMLIREFKMRKIFAAGDLSTAQIAKYEALPRKA